MFKSDYFDSEKAFRAMLPGKIALACQLIAQQEDIAILDALGRFYESPTYALLEREPTKYWWESPAQLALATRTANKPA